VTRLSFVLGPASLTRILIVATYLAAGALNARALVFGARPGPAGVVASCCYLAAWLAYAAFAGQRRDCRALRRIAMFWAVTIGGTAICGTFLRMHLGTGTAIAGGWIAPAILLVAASPLYGLAGWFGADPLGVLVAVALGAAGLIIAVALAARRWAPTPATADVGGQDVVELSRE
jgi:hypothetical protein